MKNTLTFMLLLAASMAGANPFSTNLTLEAALEYGRANHPGLQAAHSEWMAAEARIDIENGLPDPVFSYGHYFESIETRTGPQNHRFGLTQRFPAWGKRAARKAAASEHSAAAGAEYRQAENNLAATITKTFAELYLLKRRIEIAQDRIRLMQELERSARSRYKSGAPMNAMLQAQLELGRLEEHLASLNDLRHPLNGRLSVALNLPADTKLPWPAPLPEAPATPELPELLSNLRATSPELEAIAHRITQSDHQIDQAKRARRPDVSIGLQYIETGKASAPVKDSGNDPIIGTISVSLPLWGSKNRSQIDAAAHRKTAAQLKLENRRQELEAAIQQILFNLRDAERKTELYRNSLVPKAEQALAVSRKAYEAGNADFAGLIDTERTLLEFRLALERAWADHLIQRAELSRLTGTDFLSKHEGTKDPKNSIQ